MKKIALGSDHAGFNLKEAVKEHLISEGYEVLDFGTTNDESVDYPDFIRPAAQSVANQESDAGIVFGGSGNGEAIAANKVKGIRCGICWDEWSAQMTKEHNDANMIALGGRVVSDEVGIRLVDIWLDSVFEGGRHQTRIDKIEG